MTEYAFDPEYGLPVLHYRGVAWAVPSTRALVDNVERFPLDARDVFVCAFPKSGTNWVQIMLANLYDDWGTCAITPYRRVPSIDYDGGGMEGYSKCIEAVAPRLMKAHLMASHMPKAWGTNRSKVIYITRNPKDVCVSFFHQLNNAGIGFDPDFDKWVDRFASGRTIYGGWLPHILGWHALGEKDGVLHLNYETLRRDPVWEVRRVVKFLDKPLTDARFDKVIEDARFENMKASGLAEQINAGASSEKLMREGKAGGWRKHMTAAQSATIDEKVVRPLEARGIRLAFE